MFKILSALFNIKAKVKEYERLCWFCANMKREISGLKKIRQKLIDEIDELITKTENES